jgi:hypothetical protein
VVVWLELDSAERAGEGCMMNKIYRWRNIPVANAESDAEIQEINAMEEELGEVEQKAEQVRALISRIADLSHYRAFDDIDFIIEAVGEKDYPGSPALDVLPSHDDIDHERREKVKEYIYCLTSWAEGKDVEDAVAEFKANEKVLRNTYVHLGELDEEKKWLVLCLTKTLKEKASSPEDVVSEVTDEEFIAYLYKTILGRGPDDDDLNLRLAELGRGKTRQELIKSVLESKESRKRMLTEIAETIKESNGG